MRTCLSAFLVCALLLGGRVAPAPAQSLADIARREAERRKSVKGDGKVLTNKDVPRVAPTTPVPSSATIDPNSPDNTAKADTKNATEPDKAAGAGQGNAKGAADGDRPKDEKYWRERQQAMQAQQDRDQIYLDALQTRVNSLTVDFVARDDPAQRAVIATERQKALDEIARLKVAILAQTQAIADFEEEARRAGVPPGWLR